MFVIYLHLNRHLGWLMNKVLVWIDSRKSGCRLISRLSLHKIWSPIFIRCVFTVGTSPMQYPSLSVLSMGAFQIFHYFSPLSFHSGRLPEALDRDVSDNIQFIKEKANGNFSIIYKCRMSLWESYHVDGKWGAWSPVTSPSEPHDAIRHNYDSAFEYVIY